MACKNTYIYKLLRETDRARELDKKAFTEWEEGKISLGKCYELFMKNNGYRRDMYYQYDTPFYVSREDFKLWLHSLGYVRLKSDE